MENKAEINKELLDKANEILDSLKVTNFGEGIRLLNEQVQKAKGDSLGTIKIYGKIITLRMTCYELEVAT